MTRARPYRRSRKKELWGGVVIIVVLLVRWFFGEDTTLPETGRVAEGRYAVERVVDGDTIIIAEPRHRVRLQGIDTPETVKEGTAVQRWGPEATAYTQRFVATAQGTVRLQFGPERRDQYGRLLAFVWHGDRLLNEELVREGLAKAKLGYAYSESLKRRLRAAQREARAEHRGIWGDDP